MTEASRGWAAANSDHEPTPPTLSNVCSRSEAGPGRRTFGTLHHVLLSDRDLIDELKSGRLQLEPFEPALVQPSSIDVRRARWFRGFNNHLYTHIDPAVRQDDLTSAVEVPAGQPFLLHPGEFVLASTLEGITLGDQLAGCPGG